MPRCAPRTPGVSPVLTGRRPNAARAARLRDSTRRAEAADAHLVDAVLRHPMSALLRLGLGTFSRMTLRSVDLRKEPAEAVLDRAERMLGMRLDRETMARKRRSVGACTDRGTWVRVERRGLDRIRVQGGDGTASAEALHGIAKPAWLSGVAWRDETEPVMWRADETGLLPDAPVGSAVVTKDPQLSEDWWASLNASLDALAAQHTNRIATPDTETLTQELVTRTIHSVFPGVETAVVDWRPAHGDLNWANMTAPVFCLFDWEDWGMAPRGLDAANLWGPPLPSRLWPIASAASGATIWRAGTAS